MNISMQERAGKVVHLAFRAGAKRTLALLKWLPAEQRADLVDLLLSKPAVVATPYGKIRFLNHSGVSYWRARTIMLSPQNRGFHFPPEIVLLRYPQ